MDQRFEEETQRMFNQTHSGLNDLIQAEKRNLDTNIPIDFDEDDNSPRCQKCHGPQAVFTGSTQPWGMDESDCSNTPENLPGGFSWLCLDCLMELEPQDFSGLDQNSHPSGGSL